MKKQEDKSLAKEIKSKNMVVLDNSIVEAHYTMNLNEQKLFLSLVSLVDKDDDDLKEYSITAQSLTSILNISDSHIYEEIKEVAHKLTKKTLFIEDKSKKRWIEYPLFSVMRYEDGTLCAGFNDKIKPFLLKLRREFTKFQLKEFKPFKSKYSIRMYQLLKQYTLLRERTFDIKDLKLKLGIGEGELKQFVEFRRSVLNRAQRELENTRMAFEYEPIKRGRRFVKIRFILKNCHEALNENEMNYKYNQMEDVVERPSEPKEDSEPREWRVDYDKIVRLMLLLPEKERTKNADGFITEIVNYHDDEYIARQIEYTNIQNPKNYLAYLKKAVENDYANTERSELEKKIKVDQLTRQMSESLQKLKEEADHKISVEVFREEGKIYKTYMELLSDEQKNQLREESKSEVLKEKPELKKNKLSLKFEIERSLTEKIILGNQMLKEKMDNLKNRLEKEAAQDAKKLEETFKKKIEKIKKP